MGNDMGNDIGEGHGEGQVFKQTRALSYGKIRGRTSGKDKG